MRRCRNCNLEKNESEFFFKLKSAGKLHADCKQCYKLKRKLYYTQHYIKYGDVYRERARIRKAIVKQNSREKLRKYLKDKCCVNCGINDPRVLDFDHLDPATKLFGISRGMDTGLSWERLLLEIQKCQILCANCHRIRTAQQFGWSDKSL